MPPFYTLSTHQYYLYGTPKRIKWAPSWMEGDLAQPNAARVSIPHAPCYCMESESIIAGEIIAWRAWYWTGEHLRSLFVDYEWPLDAPARGIPVRGYGLHGFKTKMAVDQEYFCCKNEVLFGKVALWGDIIEYQGGYCAEYGRVHELFHNHYMDAVDEKEIMKLYGVGNEKDV